MSAVYAVLGFAALFAVFGWFRPGVRDGRGGCGGCAEPDSCRECTHDPT